MSNDNTKKSYSIDQMLASKDKKTIPAEESILGAPKKDPKKKKTKRIVSYLTESEYDSFKDLAEVADITHSDFSRKIIIEYLKKGN